jgi:MFS family permease
MRQDFRLLWTGETISRLGSNVTTVALPLVAVVALHAGPLLAGLLAAAGWLPGVLVSLPAGVWVDRWPRRPIMLGCDAVSAVLLASVPIAAGLGVLTEAQLVVVAVLAGGSGVLFATAYRVYLPTLLTPAELVGGNARLQGSEAAAQISGRSLAGVLAQAFGAVSGLLVDAASFAVSAACLLAIRTREPAPAPAAGRSRTSGPDRAPEPPGCPAELAASDAAAAERAAAEPAATGPAVTGPAALERAASEPAAPEPSVFAPGVLGPDASGPVAAEPAVSELGASECSVVAPGVPGSDVAESAVPELAASEPAAPGPSVFAPGLPGPATVPESAIPGPAIPESGASECGVFEPGLDAAGPGPAARTVSAPGAVEVGIPTAPPPPRVPLRSAIAVGLRWVSTDRYLRATAVFGALANLALTGYQAIQVVYLVRVLDVGSAALGALIAASGVGGVLGAALAVPLTRRFGTARGLLLVLAAAPAGLLIPLGRPGFGLVPVVVGGVVLGVTVAAANVILAGFRQSYPPPELRGRVIAASGLLSQAASGLGAALAGVLGAALGVRPTVLLLMALFLLAAAIPWAGPIRKRRDLPLTG